MIEAPLELPDIEVITITPLGPETKSDGMPSILIPSPSIAESFFKNEYKGKTNFDQYKIKEVFPDHKPVSWQFIEAFIAEKEDYVDPAHAEGLHGPQHEARVLLNFLTLAQAEGLPEEETIIGCLAAWGHDLARANDIKDVGHGSRSSIHILEKMKPVLVEKLKNLKEKNLISLDLEANSIDDLTGAVVDICTWHESHYGKVPNSIKKGKYGHLFRVFTDSDKLDGDRDHLIKPGTEDNPEPSREWWTKPKYLTTYSGRKFFFWGTPRYVTLSSENERLNRSLTIKEAMKEKALQLGIAFDDTLPPEGTERVLYETAA